MRLLHFADTHLGAEIHGKRDAETGMHTQLKDFLRCLDFLVQTAVDDGVDAVLFSGDAYHYARPDPLPQREFLKRIIALSERGISVLLLAGNHDLPSGYGEASALDIFNIVKIPGVVFVRKPDVVPLPTRHGTLQVVCLPYMLRRALLSLEEERGLDEEELQKRMSGRVYEEVKWLQKRLMPSGEPAVLVGHVWVQGAELAGSERMLSVTSEPIVPPNILRQDAFAYVALGHIHRHQEIGTLTPPIVYAGSLGRITFDEEKEAKGFIILDLEQGAKGRWGVKDLRFVPTPTRPFVTVRLNLRDASDPTQTALKLLAQDSRLNDAVVRVMLFITEGQRERLNLVAIREALEKRADHLAAITVRTDDPTQTLESSPFDARDLTELDRILRQKPTELLMQWLSEKAKHDPDVVQRRERLLQIARHLEEGRV